MSNPLSGLKIDYWYKALIAIGAFLFVLSLSIKLEAVSNGHMALLSSGLVLFGMGEWINHPLQTRIIPPSLDYPGWLKGHGYLRNASTGGLLLDIIGLGLVGYAIFKIATS